MCILYNVFSAINFNLKPGLLSSLTKTAAHQQIALLRLLLLVVGVPVLVVQQPLQLLPPHWLPPVLPCAENIQIIAGI